MRLNVYNFLLNNFFFHEKLRALELNAYKSYEKLQKNVFIKICAVRRFL